MEHHSNIVPWHFIRERQGAKLVWVPVDDLGVFHIEEFEKRLTDAHQARRHHPDVERAGHRDADQGDRRASRMRAAFRCWSTAARARCTCRSTCRTSTATSSSSPATRSTGRAASACSTASKDDAGAHAALPGRRRDDLRGDRGQRHLQRSAAPLRGRHAADRAGDRAGRGARLHGDRSAARRIAAHEADLKDYAHERLRSINSLRIFGDAPDKGAIISFELQGIHAHDVSMVIDRAGRRGAGRHALRPAAVETLRRDLHMPGIVRHVQYARRGRCSGRGAGKSAKILRVNA